LLVRIYGIAVAGSLRSIPVPDMIKINWPDGQGTSLFSKRLDRKRFLWPEMANGVVAPGKAITTKSHRTARSAISRQPNMPIAALLDRNGAQVTSCIAELLPLNWKAARLAIAARS
jgi:hypothetical protein